MKTFDWRKTKKFTEEDGNEMILQYAAGALSWISQDGRATLVQDLTDEHLKNIVNMLTRELPYSNKALTVTWKVLLEDEIKYRENHEIWSIH